MFCYEFTINVNFCVLDQKGTDQFWSEILLLTSLNFHLLPNLVSVFSSLITPLRHSLSPLSIYSYPSPSSPLPLPTPFPNSNLSLGTLFVRVVSDVLNGKKTEWNKEIFLCDENHCFIFFFWTKLVVCLFFAKTHHLPKLNRLTTTAADTVSDVCYRCCCCCCCFCRCSC